MLRHLTHASLRVACENKCRQAYEQTIGNWTSFRPTFARLSVNVTAYFGVAPANTTDPGLDTNAPPPGVSIALAISETVDPIFDEEGDKGGLPEYDPLKFGKFHWVCVERFSESTSACPAGYILCFAVFRDVGVAIERALLCRS